MPARYCSTTLFPALFAVRGAGCFAHAQFLAYQPLFLASFAFVFLVLSID